MAASPPPTPNVTQLPPTPVTPTIESPFRAQHKVRSYSSPFPLSALDLVPATSNDIFTPIPVEPRNYFDDVLPRELRLHVFASLVSVIVDEHQRAIDEGQWSVSKATQSRNKWVGRDRAVRELVKLSRVSKQWRSMILDGQLWGTLDLHAFGGASLASGLRIAEHGGKFVQTLDLSGHTQCSSTDLHTLTDDLCLGQFPAATQLSSVNLQGCTSLDSRSLHYLLEHTPLLRRLCVKGLPAVTNLTYKTLAACCPRLQDLDASRCANADASGVSVWARSAIVRGTHLEIVRLKLSGLKHVDEDMMLALGRAAPLLEVLDLSSARQLRNSALDAFVACADEEDGVDTVHVYARELGREGGDRYRRRVTRLRRLALSACPLLTDVACANLAYSVPQLEMLELAGIGSSLEDEGLIRLLRTTPNIRRLDLEDATEITDDVLQALTPEEDGDEELGKQPGHALEHLVVSNAGELSDAALRALIRGCPNLRVLEADGTSITPTTLREFVAKTRERQLTHAKIVAIDCRGIGEGVVKELAPQTRPRAGWRAYGARKLKYLDSRDEIYSELGKDAQDECDEGRVVLQTFHAWLAVDSMAAAREKVRRSQRRNHNSSASSEGDGGRSGGMRWWSPGGRSRPVSYAGSTANGNGAGNMTAMSSGDSCVIM
ncbi:RNI-like protein [Schizophyllum commune H4-8]|uniref:RNI-like protein n=1 Tax=Schizophyllum commune (strain H4-8 / FGSC 9210) TaxID=578458 RepID=UPI00215FF943|nr:RNI-like protein [Schizophyllum commune H4-8]KAI5897759.1 RNI-like protein [Schizophyllum commune H4-8]